MGNAFFDATTATRLGQDRFEASIEDAWNLRPLPQGGIVSALALRTMAETLAEPAQGLRTMHTVFVAQVAHGAVEVSVELLRKGRSMSHLRAEVVNVGSTRGHVTTGVFGSDRTGFAFTDLVPPPGIRPPADCPSFRDPPPPGAAAFEPMAFWTHRVEGRTLIGHPPWEDYVPDRAERAMWFAFDEPPFLDDGTMDPLALVVLADTMPGAVGEKAGPQARSWFAPSVDLTVHLLGACRSPWVLAHNRARHAADGYASTDVALWDCGPEGTSEPRIVAYATQMVFFSFAS